MDSTALTRVKQTEGGIWVPGSGIIDPNQRAISRRLEEYDERLALGQHNVTGDWCVFLKPRANPFGDNYFPVLGLGKELPTPDEVMYKLIKYDALRQGDKILEEIKFSNEKLMASTEQAAAEASGIVAEGFESFLHDNKRTPYRRVLRPLKQTGVKMS